MKTYVGTRVPGPGALSDTATQGVVVVYTRLSNDNYAWTIEQPYLLPHLCQEGTLHARRWQHAYPCHSPDGFNWGYGGSGPAELAVMILLDLELAPAFAWALHQRFKSHFVAALDDDLWVLHEEAIREWISNFPIKAIQSGDPCDALTALEALDESDAVPES